MTKFNFTSEPVFSLTSDQDWAPPGVMTDFLERVRSHKIPLHLFRTNPCKALDTGTHDSLMDYGWHPNFLPGSSHGKNAQEVIAYFQAKFPKAKTVRSHCFYEDSMTWQALAKAGIKADSQLATLYQTHLVPLRHWSGILRFPVFFEDDVFFGEQDERLNLDSVFSVLKSPGLKILNFHATFVAYNIPSREYYETVKAKIFNSETVLKELVWKGRGTATIFNELIGKILSAGERFIPFGALVE